MANDEVFGVGNIKLDLRVEENEGLYGVAAYFDIGEYRGKFFIGANAAEEIGKNLVEKGKAAYEKNLQSTKIN